MRFIPSADVYSKFVFFFVSLFFAQISPFVRFFFLSLYQTKRTVQRVFSLCISAHVMTRVPLEDMLCVDLCDLLFRTCLAPSRAMTVCMAKDLLVYTAATAAGVINSKVIYKCYLYFVRRANAAFEQSTCYSIGEQTDYIHIYRITKNEYLHSLSIKCVHV